MTEADNKHQAKSRANKKDRGLKRWEIWIRKDTEKYIKQQISELLAKLNKI